MIPYEPPVPGQRWLLKLHGCVNRPQDIVLKRSDYHRYDERRAALKGIVQALLITRHMLFVGFSLDDPNFHSIVEDVRKAASRTEASHNRATKKAGSEFGTALGSGKNRFVEGLWRGDVIWPNFKCSECNEDSYRSQEIFLDYLASLAASSTHHLMDERYDGVLSESERALRGDAAKKMLDNVDGSMKKTSAWEEVRIMLKKLGSAKV